MTSLVPLYITWTCDSGVNPGLTPVSVHVAAIIIAFARMLRKCLRWRAKFGRSVFSLFWLRCGCIEGAKYANGH